MNIRNQRKMAAKILKCSLDRVWIDPKRLKDVSQAITRNDIERLISSNIIRKLHKKGNAKNFKIERRGKGSKKGSKGIEKKEMWMRKIRALRRHLKKLKSNGRISNKIYRELYKKAKSGMFKSKKEINLYINRELKK
jgi:large subunit ribosomal protein L19e